MCDFHSTAWRLIGQDVQMCHLPTNSHSEMIAEAKWRVNEPNRQIQVFEAEGTCEADVKIRQSGECPEKVMAAIKRHYRKLEECLKTGEGLRIGEYFSDTKKYIFPSMA